MNEQILKEAMIKKQVLDKIKNSNYPIDHPFLENTFIYDLVLTILAKIYEIDNTSSIFSKSEANKSFIDQMLEEKLRAIKKEKFDYESYFQNMSELIILYYMIMGIFDTENWSKLKKINNEPRSYLDSSNLLEYSFEIQNKEDEITTYNVEIKTISCDPLYGGRALKIGDKVVKRYFNDVSLEEYFSEKQLDEMVCLNDNSHYRQLSKNMKKIDKKFKKSKNTVNIGFVVIQFATSIEEFYTYLLHKYKGIMMKNEFENTDMFVFFSMTPAPDIKLNEVYDSGHIFSIINDKKIYEDSMIRPFRLDNIIMNEKREIIKEMFPYVDVEYGVFRFVKSNGMCLFVPDEAEPDKINEYTQEISKKMKGL